jgi:hypothetical protein
VLTICVTLGVTLVLMKLVVYVLGGMLVMRREGYL